MVPFEQEIGELRELLQSEPEFKKTVDVFHDRLAMNDSFMRHCHAAAQPMCERVRRMVEAAVSRTTGRSVSLRHFLLMRCPQTDFFHGGTEHGTSLVMYFYFEKIDQGMAILSPASAHAPSAPTAPVAPTAFIRITSLPLPRGATVSRGRGQA